MDKVFGIIPASSGVLTFLWVFCIVMAVVLIGVIALFASFGYQARHATFALTDTGLRIGPGLYGRTIPKDIIEAEGVRVIDLNLEKDYQPKWRTNGAGLPGYSLGWFKLKNQEKALLFVTDRSSIVYIPTTGNYSVMLSVRDAAEMVKAIQLWK
ncbi:MAG: PH domain-containing protein [Dehalococcoidales bacterium]|jgi:hypothetical protein